MATPGEFSNLSMAELFRLEVENQSAILTGGLLELERGESSPALLESLMRAAHSLKGGARIINLADAVLVSHAMEDCFVAAQEGRIVFTSEHIEGLLQTGLKLIAHSRLLGRDKDGQSLSAHHPELRHYRCLYQ